MIRCGVADHVYPIDTDRIISHLRLATSLIIAITPRSRVACDAQTWLNSAEMHGLTHTEGHCHEAGYLLEIMNNDSEQGDVSAPFKGFI